MIRKLLLLPLLMLFVIPLAFADSFLDFGKKLDSPGFFFGAVYDYSSRNVYLGEDTRRNYKLKQSGYYGLIGANLADGFVVYGIAGLNDFQLEDNVDGEYDLKVGGGVRIKFYDFGKIAIRSGGTESRTFDFCIVGDFRANYYKSMGTYLYDKSEGELDWLQYQGTLVFKASFDVFNFYLGCKATFVNGNFTPDFLSESKFSNEGWFSTLVGGSFEVLENVKVGAEISVFAETNMGVSLQFLF